MTVHALPRGVLLESTFYLCEHILLWYVCTRLACSSATLPPSLNPRPRDTNGTQPNVQPQPSESSETSRQHKLRHLDNPNLLSASFN